MSDSPIFVTGIERSGTSVVAGMLKLCGVWAGSISKMQENRALSALVDSLYRSIGADVTGQYPLPDLENLTIPYTWKTQVTQILAKQQYSAGPWMYKSARLVQLWPVWHYAFPNARWLIIRRRTGDVLYSCEKTMWMRAFKDPVILKQFGFSSEKEGWLWWIHQHEQRFVEMIEAGLDCRIIWPDRMATGDFRQMMETVNWLRLPWSVDAMQYAAEKLWRKEK